MLSGTPYPIAAAPSGEQILDDAVDRTQHLGLVPVRRRDLDRAADRAVTRDESGEDLRPAEVDSDNTLFMHVAATITARMPEQEKPYRVYKGGRAKGRVPLQRPTDGRSKDSGRGAASSARPAEAARGALDHALAAARAGARRASGSSRATSRSRGGIKDANERVPAPAAAELKSQDGLLSSTSDDDPRARHRRRHAARPQRCPPLRLDHADPHRPGQAPARVPLDSARPPRRHPGARDGEAQRRVSARRAGADAQDRQGPDRSRRQPRRLRRLRPLQRADRLGRRHRRRRPEADPLEPLRLPVRDRRRGASSGRAGASRRGSST